MVEHDHTKLNEVDPAELFYFRVIGLKKELETIIRDFEATRRAEKDRQQQKQKAVIDPRTGRVFNFEGKVVKKK